jgi:hypothetical protein
MLVSCLAYSSILKMEVPCSSEMSIDFQQTTQCYIPVTCHTHCWENLKSYLYSFVGPLKCVQSRSYTDHLESDTLGFSVCKQMLWWFPSSMSLLTEASQFQFNKLKPFTKEAIKLCISPLNIKTKFYGPFPQPVFLTNLMSSLSCYSYQEWQTKPGALLTLWC